MNNVKYKLTPELIERLPEGTQLYADPEDAFAALAAKVVELAGEVAALREGANMTIEPIEAVSVLEEEHENVIPISGVQSQLPFGSGLADRTVTAATLSSRWCTSSEIINKLSKQGKFEKVSRGNYDIRSVEAWSGPIVPLSTTKEAAKHYGITPAMAVSWAHRGKLRVINIGLRDQANFRYDLSYDCKR